MLGSAASPPLPPPEIVDSSCRLLSDTLPGRISCLPAAAACLPACLQVFSALDRAQSKVGFLHADLGMRNVMEHYPR